MDANDLAIYSVGSTVPRLREDSPRRQMASLPAQLPNVLIYCGILVRLPFRLFIRLAVKAWRHHILGGGTVRRLREDSPGPQIVSPAVQLPDDLIYLSILPRLPFRQLLRAAAVCKAWRQLILGDPAFARMQARCPSPASAVLARYHGGRLEALCPGAVGPPDASLSFLPVVVANAEAKLRFCSVTRGLLCLMANAIGGRDSATIFVVNPATRAFRAVPYAGDGRFMPCLAYDPSMVHHNGYHIVLPAQVTSELWRFWSFSSAASSGGGWRLSGAEVRLTPSDFVVSKPLYLGGRAHWLCERGGMVWHDAMADAAGALPRPTLIPGEQGPCLEGRKVLVAWHGRIGIVSAGLATGLAVWALSSSSSPAQWEMVHRRSWDEIPGVAPPASCFMWSLSVVPAGMEGGGEKALGLAVRMAHGQHGVDGAGGEEEEVVWRRELLRYDISTGATAVVAELVGRDKHDDFGAVFCYHSSMAPLD
ncbi:uncharacterized protein LOC124662974 [Lolium rigidum]|uniref:uncharacterized protein LOC124662974 n=1 Tax=Lolium rigidum TaxID=89674 RepID=UPI001F5C36A9|nr:uncharacterized protein LOC124662974 [Lolium rigidum]